MDPVSIQLWSVMKADTVEWQWSAFAIGSFLSVEEDYTLGIQILAYGYKNKVFFWNVALFVPSQICVYERQS